MLPTQPAWLLWIVIQTSWSRWRFRLRQAWGAVLKDNQLTSLDVSVCTELGQLDCGNNQLASLDLSNNSSITWLFVELNQLTALT